MEEVQRLPDVGSVLMPVTDDSARLDLLTEICLEDLLSAFGLGGMERGRWLAELPFRAPVRRLARQVMVYDEVVGESGLGAGGAWALKRMARRSEVVGEERVPREGPLLIVSNHPGLGDSVALFAAIPRADLRVVAERRPFLEALPNTSRYLIPVDKQAPGQMGPVRAISRQLKSGGAVLTFPGGKIEPDPAVLPGAADFLSDWSGSVDLFARMVPDLTVLPVTVSGVLSERALRNPLRRVRREKRDQEWLAATIQMLVPALRDVSTRVTFGNPIRTGELPPGADSVSGTVVEEMRRLLSRTSGQRQT